MAKVKEELARLEVAIAAFRAQLAISGPGRYLFPSNQALNEHETTLKTVSRLTLKRAGVQYSRLRSRIDIRPRLSCERSTALESAQLNSPRSREWLHGLKSYTHRWIEEHRDGGVDNWTVGAVPETRLARLDSTA